MYFIDVSCRDSFKILKLKFWELAVVVLVCGQSAASAL